MWFLANSVDKYVIRITVGGQLTAIQWTASASGMYLEGIAAGPEGGIWFSDTQISGMSLSRYTPSTGARDFFGAPVGSPQALCIGSDQAVWFAANSAVGRVTTNSVVTIFTLPSSLPPNTVGSGITAGPDGNIWYTDPGRNAIGRINLGSLHSDVSVALTEFTIPTANAYPQALVSGSDG